MQLETRIEKNLNSATDEAFSMLKAHLIHEGILSPHRKGGCKTSFLDWVLVQCQGVQADVDMFFRTSMKEEEVSSAGGGDVSLQRVTWTNGEVTYHVSSPAISLVYRDFESAWESFSFEKGLYW